jgi:hypothetical protein
MDNNKSISNVELPSTKKLVKSTVLAICIAAVILITTVLPAEYGIDPSGVGEMLDLTKMGKIKTSLAEEAASIKLKESTNSELVESLTSKTYENQENVKIQNGEMVISLKPNEGKELKLYMKEGDEVNYTWFTDGVELKFDAHTDSGEYHNYNKGTKNSDQGILKAFYDGRHGWYWKNRTSQIVKIALQVEGRYSDFREES